MRGGAMLLGSVLLLLACGAPSGPSLGAAARPAAPSVTSAAPPAAGREQVVEAARGGDGQRDE